MGLFIVYAILAGTVSLISIMGSNPSLFTQAQAMLFGWVLVPLAFILAVRDVLK